MTRAVFSPQSWYGGLLFVALLWGTIAKALSGDREHWLGLSVVWLVVISIFSWVFISVRRPQHLVVVAFNQSLPDVLAIADEGIWTVFTHWCDGFRVVFLSLSRTHGLVVPLGDLDAANERVLRDMLQAHLGKPHK